MGRGTKSGSNWKIPCRERSARGATALRGRSGRGCGTTYWSARENTANDGIAVAVAVAVAVANTITVALTCRVAKSKCKGVAKI